MFCPNSHYERTDVKMPDSYVEKMFTELKALKWTGLVQWYLYNEPTRDSRLPEFLALAKALVPKACHQINTNGDSFKTWEDIAYWLDAGLTQMQINVYAVSEEPGAVEAGKRREVKMRELVKQLIEHKPGVAADGPIYRPIKPSDPKVVKVVGKWGPTSGNDKIHNRSGNIPNYAGAVNLTEPIAKSCTRPFRQFNVNYKGDVILCCNDYYGATNFGNVGQSTIQEIWHSEAFNLYRKKLYAKKRDIFLCDKCDFPGGAHKYTLHDIPGYETELNADLTARESIPFAGVTSIDKTTLTPDGKPRHVTT